METFVLRSGRVENGQALMINQEDEISLTSHNEDIISIAMSSNKQTVAVSMVDNKVCIWDNATNAYSYIFDKDLNERKTKVVITPDGKTVAFITASGKLYATRAPYKETIPIGYSRVWNSKELALSNDGAFVVTPAKNERVCVWDIDSGKQTYSPSKFTNPVSAVAITPDNKMVIFGTKGGNVGRWIIGTNTMLYMDDMAMISKITSIAISADGSTFGTLDVSNGIAVYDTRTGINKCVIDNYAKQRGSFVISSDGRTLSINSGNGVLHIIDAESGEFIEEKTVEKCPSPEKEPSPRIVDDSGDALKAQFPLIPEEIVSAKIDEFVSACNTKSKSIRRIKVLYNKVF